MRPNVLLILADQFRADAIGCVGGYARTPALDALARRGCLFERAYASAPECIPSRISLATGFYPHQFGVQKNVDCNLRADFPTWMRAFREAGYRTSFFGKSHYNPQGTDLRGYNHAMHAYGFDEVDEITGPRGLMTSSCRLTDLWEERGVWDAYRSDLEDRFATKAYVARPSPLPFDLYYDVYVGQRALEHLRQQTADAPWFCCVSFAGPHEPWDAPEPFASAHAPSAMPQPRPRSFDAPGSLVERQFRQFSPPPTSEDIAHLRANYAGSVMLIDEQISQLVQALARRDQLAETLIVFTSDHGEMNGDHGLVYKSNFLEPSISIPLIVVPPIKAARPTQQRCDALVALMDVGPTLLDYAGLPIAAPTQAQSMRPLIEHNDSPSRDMMLIEYDGHACAVTRDLKLEIDASGEPVLAVDRQDLDEQRNVVREASYAVRIEQQRARLTEFIANLPAVPAVTLTQA